MRGHQVSRVSRVTPRQCVDPLDWLLEKFYWSGLDVAPSCPREDYRGALRGTYGDSEFIQPPVKVI